MSLPSDPEYDSCKLKMSLHIKLVVTIKENLMGTPLSNESSYLDRVLLASAIALALVGGMMQMAVT
ncbi:hypothetical protein U5801_21525, partial [Lamprobacter modestohalophilus]|uniref:hypothetical protein n=1 Tax=Lamprobacter modestohalophilus TaxID=1064514 RepID=UPI002ADEF3A3